jgi:tetratricopeptide (TPR) repeat protein
MSEEAEEPVVEAPAPAPAPAPKMVKETAIVPIKEETVEFTAGILGGIAGFAVGGPVLGAIFAAAANYASKNESEVGEVMSAVSKTSIEVYNYLAKLDTKYEVLDKAKSSLEKALDKLKAQGDNSEAIEKVEKALKTTTSKISELNDEYDLVGGGVTALGVIGDLVEKAVKRFGELNEEYSLTEKAKEALKGAIEKAKTAANN